MNPLIFFFDIDQTLLDYTVNAIPTSALDAIARIKDQGHHVVLATGRSYGHAKSYIEQIQPLFSITQNGARILKQAREVWSTTLPKRSLEQLFSFASSYGIAYGVNDGLVGYVNDIDHTHVVQAMSSMHVCVNENMQQSLENTIYQAYLFISQSQFDALSSQLLAFSDFDYVRWHEFAIDVIPKDIHKFTGCLWVMKQMGIEHTRCVAFGDGLNDMQMLQNVGLGVAVGNAHPSLKAVADMICEPIAQDGIALATARILEKYQNEGVLSASC